VTRDAPRHASRQLALQALYAFDLGSNVKSAREREDLPSAEEVFESVAANFDLAEGARAFAKELVCGVMEQRDVLDREISRYARNWRVDRMATVDRNVLRIAVFELLHTDTPISIVIDQAVELARRFGDDPSPAFVNGVLDAVAHGAGRAGGEAT
jgi:N utilization substance protein B